ncbi:MAG: MarR family winged helix-turn-helix transcriptional regulator [Microbacterium sp.]|uniref:MarR family winged helix-turn-helix transcriptional regulator n=1 Tax=Microbacterium sp. TaxID=51671 RepID=UPI0039E389BF
MTSPPRYPLGALLGRVQARYVAECEARLAAAGYSDLRIAHGANILRHLSPDRPVRIAVIARLSGVSKQAISQQIAHLAARDYLIVGPDDSDGRAKSVVLTARGARSQRAVRRIFADVEAEWRALHGAERLEALRAALESITDAPDSPSGTSAVDG